MARTEFPEDGFCLHALASHSNNASRSAHSVHILLATGVLTPASTAAPRKARWALSTSRLGSGQLALAVALLDCTGEALLVA